MAAYFPDFIQSVDLSILSWIQTHLVSPFCDGFFKFVTHFGDGGIFWILVAVVMLFFKKSRKTGIMMGAALILGVTFGNGILKNLFQRVRPFDLENALVQVPIIAKPGDWSFPSGHTLASFEAATVLMIRDKRFGIPALILAVLVAFSRLYLYVHFPSDVLSGALLGILFGYLGVWIVNKIWEIASKKFNKA